MTAFVLGNGHSRKHISVDRLIQLAPVYGCNALYRTHTPTALIATDRQIAEAIQHSGYAKRARFYTRRPLTGLGAMTVPKEYYGFSSGPIATAIAALDANKIIYLLGFDMGPSPAGRINNLYADTEFYKPSSSPPTFAGNWTKQLIRVAKDFPNIEFVRVHGDTTAEVEDFANLPNFKKMDISDFAARINNPKDL